MAEYQIKERERLPQPIRLVMPINPDVPGCTGIARLGICIRCDRLHLAGGPIKPRAQRGSGGVYECPDQVVDGKHVTSIPRESGIEQSATLGGMRTAIPANEGCPE